MVMKLSTRLAKLEEAVDAAIERAQEDVAVLVGKADELQDKVEVSEVTAEDIATMKTILAKLDALDPEKPAVLPGKGEPPPAEAPPVEPPVGA